MITAPVAQLPRGGGQTGRGHHRGRGQARRDQPATSQLGGGQPAGAPARFYALLARPDALASDAIMRGIISVYSRDASVLFDPGSTYSYVSSLFAYFLVIPCKPLGTPVHVSTPVGDSVVVDQIYWSYVVTFCVFETRVDLPLLDMINFEAILGMDWLAPYHTVFDCHAKTVTLAMPGLPRLEWKESSTIDLVLVVQEFADVFPSNLPSMPPDHDIDFCIDLALGTQPISIPPYRMASQELKEKLE
ncbi:uncharacterized protein [Nicotiana sylvestris]|uniref:uncharacterized protein n=1 Tax=Nicotiana sylvestris TaxID=4096 RepID=UPI00388C852A